jgi:threonine aldolase
MAASGSFAIPALRRPADFRSDTVTKPSLAMGEAMLAVVRDDEGAGVGDDVYGEDATISRLEREVAALLGKAAAVFVPTCTMANLLAVGSHCARGAEVILGAESHIFVYEQAGASWLMGAPFHTVPNNEDGTMPLEFVRHAIALRGDGSDAHHARPGLICVENTQNRCGGMALPQSYMDELASVAHAAGIPLHCDGARLLNAAAALGVAPAALVAGCDSVSLCLSKGLGAPAGAVLAGSEAVVARARRLRKAVGGGMRQAGVLAVTGIVALRDNTPKLLEDHARARRLAALLSAVEGIVPQARVDSNIIFVALDAARASPAHLAARVAAARAAGAAELVDAPSGARLPLERAPAAEASAAVAFATLVRELAHVKIGSYGTTKFRVVLHYQISDEDCAALAAGAAAAVRLMSAP